MITTPLYPFVFQLPDGRVMQAGASEGPTDTRALNLTTQQWSIIDPAVLDGGSIRQYALGKFIKAGSATDAGGMMPATATPYPLHLTAPHPTRRPPSPT